jgi:hypothetical protein
MSQYASVISDESIPCNDYPKQVVKKKLNENVISDSERELDRKVENAVKSVCNEYVVDEEGKTVENFGFFRRIRNKRFPWIKRRSRRRSRRVRRQSRRVRRQSRRVRRLSRIARRIRRQSRRRSRRRLGIFRKGFLGIIRRTSRKVRRQSRRASKQIKKINKNISVNKTNKNINKTNNSIKVQRKSISPNVRIFRIKLSKCSKNYGILKRRQGSLQIKLNQAYSKLRTLNLSSKRYYVVKKVINRLNNKLRRDAIMMDRLRKLIEYYRNKELTLSASYKIKQMGLKSNITMLEDKLKIAKQNCNDDTLSSTAKTVIAVLGVLLLLFIILYLTKGTS